jgi:hypothetical protein
MMAKRKWIYSLLLSGLLASACGSDSAGVEGQGQAEAEVQVNLGEDALGRHLKAEADRLGAGWGTASGDTLVFRMRASLGPSPVSPYDLASFIGAEGSHIARAHWRILADDLTTSEAKFIAEGAAVLELALAAYEIKQELALTRAERNFDLTLSSAKRTEQIQSATEEVSAVLTQMVQNGTPLVVSELQHPSHVPHILGITTLMLLRASAFRASDKTVERDTLIVELLSWLRQLRLRATLLGVHVLAVSVSQTCEVIRERGWEKESPGLTEAAMLAVEGIVVELRQVILSELLVSSRVSAATEGGALTVRPSDLLRMYGLVPVEQWMRKYESRLLKDRIDAKNLLEVLRELEPNVLNWSLGEFKKVSEVLKNTGKSDGGDADYVWLILRGALQDALAIQREVVGVLYWGEHRGGENVGNRVDEGATNTYLGERRHLEANTQNGVLTVRLEQEVLDFLGLPESEYTWGFRK